MLNERSLDAFQLGQVVVESLPAGHQGWDDEPAIRDRPAIDERPPGIRQTAAAFPAQDATTRITATARTAGFL
jgi:hypothetical protein